MDKDVIRNKLTSLIRFMKRIEGRKPASPEALAGDLDAQDIIVLNLERAVQLCVDIGLHIIAANKAEAPITMSEVFTRLHELDLIPGKTADSLSKAVGFRNIAVDQYRSIDWAIVFSILKENMADFKAFTKSIFDILDKP